MLLIGSRALSLRCPQALVRKPLDFDFISTKEEFDTWLEKNRDKVGVQEVYELPEFSKWIIKSYNSTSNCEFEIITPNTSSELLANIVYNDKDSLETPFGVVPSLPVLLAIKDSHKFKKFETPRGCANWYKHAIDWHMLTRLGVPILPEYQEFISLREKETYTHKLPKLNMSKENFFDTNMNGVKQTFVHDDIHIAVALYDRPAYTYYLKSGSEVLTDKDKFFSVPEHIKLAGVIEEAIVLAIERSQVAHPGVWAPDYAFRFALAKVCSTITGGYFRNYSFLNLFKALQEYPKDYWEIFQRAVQAGTVRYIDTDQNSMCDGD